MKMSILQEDITILNVTVPNKKSVKILEGKTVRIARSTRIIGVINLPLSAIDRFNRQNLNAIELKAPTINWHYRIPHQQPSAFSLCSHKNTH